MIELVIGTSLATSARLNTWMPPFLPGLADRLLPAWSLLSGDIALWTIDALLVLEIVADKIPALDSINDVVQSIPRPASGGIAFGVGAGLQTFVVDDPSRSNPTTPGSRWSPAS